MTHGKKRDQNQDRGQNHDRLRVNIPFFLLLETEEEDAEPAENRKNDRHKQKQGTQLIRPPYPISEVSCIPKRPAISATAQRQIIGTVISADGSQLSVGPS